MENKKTCTKCNKELPATTEFFYKQKMGMFGIKSTCKDCDKNYNKEYRSDPEFKKRHRDKIAKWRKDNPEKSKEANRRCYAKNKDRFNETRRKRYKTDPEYRQKRKEAEKRYKATGAREKQRSTKEYKDKAIARNKLYRSIPENKKKISEYNKKYREDKREYVLGLYKTRRENLTDGYVLGQITRYRDIDKKDIPQGMIEHKRLLIKLKRELKK